MEEPLALFPFSVSKEILLLHLGKNFVCGFGKKNQVLFKPKLFLWLNNVLNELGQHNIPKRADGIKITKNCLNNHFPKQKYLFVQKIETSKLQIFTARAPLPSSGKKRVLIKKLCQPPLEKTFLILKLSLKARARCVNENSPPSFTPGEF